jgi:CHAT domain-containing protein
VVRTGFDANRAAILDSNLADFRLVHFATHGKVDSRYPSLSWLAFSRFDAQANAREGLLRLHDIYELELAADLVTMSACDTALGREIRGEGLAGLVQGFMYAGARSVLASLWQVPDRATAELMGNFYRNLLEHDQSPPEALRNAQAALASRARFRHPYFWSAFVLQGDWKSEYSTGGDFRPSPASGSG